MMTAMTRTMEEESSESSRELREIQVNKKKSRKRRRGKPRTAQILLKASDASLNAPQIPPCPTDQLIIVM
jgi:hypothetical protein